jgi:hypothetical protein
MRRYPNAPGFVAGSTTSEAAAESVVGTAYTMRARVYAAIFGAGEYGFTDDELEVLLRMRGSTVRPRRRELVLKGLIADAGFTRVTRSGRQAVVYVARAKEVA